jgi:predicted ribosome quality control (RQC) complex YloA/Tae2 family protein
MAFDGNLIHHLVNEWNDLLVSGRIQKIYQISRFDVLFVVHANKQKHQLFVSSSPRYARCYVSRRSFDMPSFPPAFGMFLRKQLEGGILRSISQHQRDRVIDLTIEKYNELGDLAQKHLILEMMGRYSNIVVTDPDYVILDAIKHNVNFDSDDRTLFPGARYLFPPTDQIDPSDDDALRAVLANPDNWTERALQQRLMGFSPQAIKEIFFRRDVEGTAPYDTILHLMNDKHPVWFHGTKDKFYATDLHHIRGDRTAYKSVNELLDDFYHERDKIDLVTQYAKDLKTFLKTRIQRNQNKIDKLVQQQQDTAQMDEHRLHGELIQANLHEIKKGMTKLDCVNYYTNEPLTIPLDPLLTPIENSERCFKRYKKLKHSIPHIERQIALAKQELAYFQELDSQLDYASLQDIEEIRDELIDAKYLHGKRRKQKKKAPKFDTYQDDSGIRILVGKNNLQNEHLTHKTARGSDVWFHVQNAPGSHVVVQAPQPLEEPTIRLAAHLAAYFSSQRQSSSVAVDYTDVRHVKKIPGHVGSFVRYTNQKTIYIDPDEAIVTAAKTNR